MAELLTLGPIRARNHLLLAHGAGAPMTSPFMEAIARGLVAKGLCVHRFEFEYMAVQGSGGTRRAPPKAELLMPHYAEVAQRLAKQLVPKSRLFIGGKSMGGRVASLVAGDLYHSGANHLGPDHLGPKHSGQVAGLVCLGYPFHPPRQPEKLRTAHLSDFACPTLIVQGTRDPFGGRAECESYELSDKIKFHWIEDGNHDLTPPRRSGRTFEHVLGQAAAAIVAFIEV